MKYVVVKTGGKQYKVAEGDVIEVERLNQEAGDYIFNDVLLYVSDDTRLVGVPRVSGITVKGNLLEHTKGDKLRISKFKAKAKYRRTTGHRQSLSKVAIVQIVTDSKPQKEEKKIKSQTKKK